MFHGVPQGTILGPLLYSIYCNRLVNANIKGELVAYADDTVIINTDDSWDLVHKKATDDLAKISDILIKDHLILNINKTKFINFNKNNLNNSVDKPLIIHSGNCPREDGICDCHKIIEKVTSIKYLGLHIDYNMKWRAHTKALASKLGKIKYMLKSLSGFLRQNQLKQVYFAFAQSIIGYGIIAWGGGYHNVIRPVEIQQKLIIKTLFNMRVSFPTEQLFAQTGLLNVHKLYIKSICTYIHKNKDLKKYISHKYNTRANLNNKLQIEAMKTAIGQHNIIYNAAKFYNKMPKDIADIKCIHRFKRKLNAWLIQADTLL